VRKLLLPIVAASTVSFATSTLFAQTTANERNCPSSHGMAEAIPPFVGPGSAPFSPNQSLCLPQLAPVPTGVSPLAFIVRGVEPGDRVDPQGTVYAVSIRGVPGGVDLWRWDRTLEGSPNADHTLPFKYEGQPDNCGIYSFTNGGCAHNVGNPTNFGVALGGGDADIAVNSPDPVTGVPNLPFSSLSLVPGVSVAHSTDRGDNFSPLNPLTALLAGDDRQWMDAIDSKTVYLGYHDVATFNIDVQRSGDGGVTYLNGFGEAIDPRTFPAAGNVTPTATANLAAQIKIDHSSCASRGNLYQLFVAPDNTAENIAGASMRSAYVGVSRDAKVGLPAFMFTDYKIYTGPTGATNGNIFPALAVDRFGFLYSVWSDNSNIFFTSSSDHGKTWTSARVINQVPTLGKANVFPWVAADANGHVVVVWLGADRAGNSNDRTVMEPDHTPQQNGACTDFTTTCMTKWANWSVYVLETVNGQAATPTFTQFTASDHVIHRGTVSTGGLGGGADRGHRANISFADDHVVSPLCTTQTPGHCGADDPQSFREGVPYFTYRLQPPAGLVTDGSCAGVSGEQDAEDEGAGEDDQHDEMSFVDHGQPEENGTLVYHDPGQSLDVTSSNGVRSISYSGNCVSFVGDAKVSGQLGYQFTFGACDFSATGGTGSFSISLTGPAGFSYQKQSTLTTGFVELNQVLQP
jgi:hypothetical protein